MNLHLLSAELAALVPELAKDSRHNNEHLIYRILLAELLRNSPAAGVSHNATTTAPAPVGNTPADFSFDEAKKILYGQN